MRKDVRGEHATQGPSEWHRLLAQRRELQVLLKTRGRLVAGNDGKELRLTRIVLLGLHWLSHRGQWRDAQSYKYTVTVAPSPKPSLSPGTITKPSARVVDERIDAPLRASGSIRFSAMRTRQ